MVGRWTLTGSYEKAIADANGEKVNLKAEKDSDELGEALNVHEEQLSTITCTGPRQYDSEDGTRPSRVNKTTATRVFRSVLKKKTTRPQEHEIVESPGCGRDSVKRVYPNEWPVVAALTPEEKMAPEHKKQGPEESKAGKQAYFVLRPTYDAIGRELISLVAATLR